MADQMSDTKEPSEEALELHNFKAIYDKALLDMIDAALLAERNKTRKLLEGECEVLRQRAEKAEAEAAVKSECIAFFACTIKSGERWTPDCDEYLEKSKLGSRFLARFKAMKEALTFISGQNLPGNWAVELARKTLQEGGEGMMIKLEKATPEIKEGTDVIVRRARAEKAEADAAAILDALQKLYDVVANETDMDACSDQLMDAMTNANEVLKAAAALREKK